MLTNVHETHSSLVGPGIVEVVQDWHQQVQHVAALSRLGIFRLYLEYIEEVFH